MRNDNDEPRRLGRGAKLYEADPGEIIDVYSIDVPVLAARGFTRVDRDTPAEADDAGDGERALEDLNLDELQELARERDLPGRSTLNKGELIAALRDSEE